MAGSLVLIQDTKEDAIINTNRYYIENGVLKRKTKFIIASDKNIIHADGTD